MEMDIQITKNDLPNDVEALKTLLISSQEIRHNLQQEITELKNQYQGLLEQLRLSKQMRFGRTSEKDNPHQLGLFDEAGITPDAPIEDETITVPTHKRKKHGGRKPLPEDLPREEVIIEPDDKDCACCQKARPKIGEAVTEKLEITPMQLKVKRYVRPKYGACCEHEGVAIAPMPRLFLPKHQATPSLASHFIISKFEYHLPLYRQAKIWQQHGIDFPRNTIARIILDCAKQCEPLLELFKQNIIQSQYLQIDETPLQVLHEKNKANTSKSFMWCYQSRPPDKSLILFDYQPSRSSEHPKVLLKDFQGHIQTDGYSGYRWVDTKNMLTHGGCLAHARRKFVDVTKITQEKGLADIAVQWIAKLYAIEKQARMEKLNPAQRFMLRLKKAKPILNDFHDWLIQHCDKAPPQSTLGKAFTYIINQWPYLTTYLYNGHYEIDNNPIENQLRPFTLGRKNWLFHGSPQGAKAGAMFYSFIASAKAHELNPELYLNYIFNHIRDCDLTRDYNSLLPENLTSEIIQLK